jgi:transcriptional regulator with XRE-family HTH domain
MEFNEKLQELRKQRGMTQEELAQVLYVSRTAISKWESGRGYPNIESLKAIAKHFSVTVDELLSSDQLLKVAEEDKKQTENSFRDKAMGLVDLSSVMLVILPLFAERAGGTVSGVPLLALSGVQPYLKIVYFAVILTMAAWGILALALQGCRRTLWSKCNVWVSLGLSLAAVLIFILGLHPYAAAFAFATAAIKAFILIKR